MALRPALQDEYHAQTAQCKALGVDAFDDDADDDIDAHASWGADPFCILAQLEEDLGYPLALS